MELPPAWAIAGTHHRRVAILEIRADGVEDDVVKPLPEVIAADIASHAGYEVASAEEVRRIIESEQSLDGCFQDDACTSRIARELHADLVVSGSVEPVGHKFKLNLSVADPKEMASVHSTSETMKHAENLPVNITLCLQTLFEWGKNPPPEEDDTEPSPAVAATVPEPAPAPPPPASPAPEAAPDPGPILIPITPNPAMARPPPPPPPPTPAPAVAWDDQSDASATVSGPTGSLRLETLPRGAFYRINGKASLNQRTPATIPNLQAGRIVKILFVAAGYESKEVTVAIVAGEETSVRSVLQLRKPTVKAPPPDADRMSAASPGDAP